MLCYSAMSHPSVRDLIFLLINYLITPCKVIILPRAADIVYVEYK